MLDLILVIAVELLQIMAIPLSVEEMMKLLLVDVVQVSVLLYLVVFSYYLFSNTSI